jgi:AsmA-like protein
MTRRTLRFLWIGGSLLALVVAACLAVPFLVDINRYHDLIESQAEKMLHRDVTVGRMSLRLLPLPGVEVSPVTIASDRPGDPPLLKAEALSARARLLPLLRGQIAVASLVVSRPVLNLHRYPDGHTNLPAPPSPPPSAAGGGAPSGDSPAAAFSLSRMHIHHARLRLADEAVLPGKTVTTTLDPVDLALNGFAPGRPFGVDLETSLPPRRAGSLVLKGIVALPPDDPGRAAGVTDVSLRMKNFQPSAFAPYIRAFAGIDPPQGSVSADLAARARLRTNDQRKWEVEGGGSLRGSLEMRGVALKGGAGGPPLPHGDLDLALEMNLGDGGRKIAFTKLEAATGKSRLAAGGSLELSGRASRVDVTVRPSQVMAGDIATLAALLGAKFPAGLTSAAPITFSGSVAGPLDDPERMKFKGEIALSGVRYSDPALGRPIEDAGGKLTFQNDALKVSDFAARVGGTKVAGSLAVKDFDTPQLTVALSSPRANLDDLLALLTPATPPRPSGPSAAPGGDVLARTRGAGTIRIDEGSFGSFRFSRFDGSLRLEGKVVTFDPVSFQLYGGSYRGSLSADLRGAEPRYSYSSVLGGVDGGRFLAENFGMKDLLAGTVSADVTLEGGGVDLDRILGSLSGQGAVKVERGWIGQLNVMGGLSKASDLLGEKTLAKVSGEIAKNRTDFSSLTGDIRLAGGRATTDNLKVVTRDMDLAGKGSFTLAGMLDMDVKILFSPEITTAMLQEGSRARYLDREGNRIVLPLTIQGPLESPRYGVDLQSITRLAAKTRALEKISKSDSPLGQLAAGLLGKQGGDPGAPPSGTPSAAPAPPSEPSSAAPAGDGAIRISSRKFEGNFLVPDLTIRGEFTGSGMVRADVRVEGSGGRPLLEKTDAFREIAAYYATHDRAQPARIPFKLKIDGKRIAGAGDLKITLTLHRSDGTSTSQIVAQPKHGL